MRTPVFVTYESPYAPCGGVAAVLGRLPGALEKVAGRETLVLTPYHHRIEKTRSLDLEEFGEFSVRHDGGEVPVKLLRLRSDPKWVFIRPTPTLFFAGKRHPYDLSEDPWGPTAALLRDSLLFGSAVAGCLELLDPERSHTLFLQDWEAATAAFSVLESERDDRLVLTLHNTYDAQAPDWDLERHGFRPEAAPGATVLSRVLPRLDTDLLTVSTEFARDMTEEVWQTGVMAPHLQSLFARGIRGIDNGPFTQLQVGEKILDRARQGKNSSLKGWKTRKRNEFLKAVAEFEPTPDRPVWGNRKKFRGEGLPWFVLAGRDDPRQKGYDVAARAVEDYLDADGAGSFLFFPIPGEEGLDSLSFLKELAERFPERVLAFPFIFKEGFVSALQGAAYGVMPSLYEPFGMANEFYLNGTVGIGRAGGGITQQIVPVGTVLSFSEAARGRAERVYGKRLDLPPTGFLYRERADLDSEESDWRAIDSTEFDPEGPDRVEQRSSLPLFRSMADELGATFRDATRAYLETPDAYCRMLVEGIDHIEKKFSWEKTAKAYADYLAD